MCALGMLFFSGFTPFVPVAMVTQRVCTGCHGYYPVSLPVILHCSCLLLPEGANFLVPAQFGVRLDHHTLHLPHTHTHTHTHALCGCCISEGGREFEYAGVFFLMSLLYKSTSACGWSD